MGKKKKQRKINKIAAWVVVFGVIFSEITPIVVQAASLTTSGSTIGASIGPINSANNQRMGTSNKQQSPDVTVSFSVASGIITQGAKVTATAAPGYFKDDSSKLYYTWYLERNGCGLTKNPDGSKGKNPGDINRCDLDGDGEITVNDWKIAATQIIVKGSYDNTGETYSSSVDPGLSGYEANPSPSNTSANGNKGWVINSGADVNSVDAPNCYVQEPESGVNYELRKVDPLIQACPSGYQKVCATSGQNASCEVLNPSYDPVAAAGDPNYAIPKTITQTTDKFCAITNDSPVDNKDIYCKVTDLANFQTAPYCNTPNAVAMCVKYSTVTAAEGNAVFPDTTPVSSSLAALVFKKNNLCSSLNRNATTPPAWLTTKNTLFSGLQNQTCETAQGVFVNGDGTNTGDTSTILNCSTTKAGNVCKHLFAKEPRSVGGVVGDGKFTLAEKKFWGANPSVSSTNGSGADEANVVGLGVDKFSWLYTTGDQVGVVVEGDSAFQTNHADAAYKRMWAFSNNQCTALSDLHNNPVSTFDGSPTVNSMYLEGPGGATCDPTNTSGCTGFLTTELDLDSCLEENLLDPTSNENSDVNSKLNLQVVSEPANPINDPAGRGDTLNVTAASFNSQDSNSLSYNWTVQLSRDGSMAPIDTTSWKDITTDLEAIPSFSAADASGIGKQKLAIKLNLSDALIKGVVTGKASDGFYLKIKAKAKGTAIDGSQDAEGFVMVKVRQQQNEIKIYGVTANNTGMLTMDSGGVELCASAAEKSRCYVAQNEIVGIMVDNKQNELTNFSWKANGAAVTCDASVSSQCSTVGGNKIFVPILGNTGEAVDVIAKAINTKTNEAVELSRHFVITKMQAQINSTDETKVWPKLLGYYKDLNDNRYPDYSTSVFESAQGSTADLIATFYPSSLVDQSQLEWSIDGETKYELSNKKQINFPIKKAEGENYNIGFNVKYKTGSDSQVNNLRKALLKDWKIEPANLIDEQENVSLQINVVSPGSQKVASKEVQSGLASLISHLPENLMFLLKIVVTSGALLLLTGIVFAVMPENIFSEDN